jgi:hypothetical protein
MLVEFGGAVVVNVDGDFSCSETCKREYKSKMNTVLNMPDRPFENWMLSK